MTTNIETTRNQLSKLFEGEGAVTGGKTYADLTKEFNSNLDAAKGMINFGEGKDFILTTSADRNAASGNNYILNGGKETDTLLVDNYRIANPSDISVKPDTFTDVDGNKVKGYTVTITGTDPDGNKAAPRTYRVTDIEKISYVDTSGKVQTLDIKNELEKKSTTQTLSVPKTPQQGIPKFSDKDDVATVTGSGKSVAKGRQSPDDIIGVSFNMGGGSDTARVTGLSTSQDIRYVDQLSGGAGVDTIEFTSITEADISRISYDSKSKNYRLFTKDGGNIMFKDFEHIKIGQNTYTIPPQNKGSFHLQDMFKDGVVNLTGFNNTALTKTGMTFGAKNDAISILDAKALGTGNTVSKINGGAGVNSLDLSSLKLAANSTPKFTTAADGTTTLEIQTSAGSHKIELQNFQTVKIAGKTYEFNGKVFVEAKSTQTNLKENVIKGPIDWSSPSLPKTIGEKQADGVYNTLELDRGVNDYIFTATGDGNDSQYFIALKSFPDVKIELSSINAIKFLGDVPAQKYIIRGIGGGLMNDKLALEGMPVLSFGTINNASKEKNYSLDDYFTGSEGNDSLSGFDGKDKFLESAGTDVLDGGEGMDTFIASRARDEYSITKNADGTIQVKDNADGSITTLKNFEQIVFANADGSSETMSLSNFTFDTVGDAGNNSFTWTALYDETWDGGAGSDTAIIPAGADIKDLVVQENLAIISHNGRNLQLDNFEFIQIGNKKYQITPGATPPYALVPEQPKTK